MTFQWGLMGPDQVPSARRTRTLGLGKTVRFFNERAVPGLGNLWFAKQLVLAALGIAVAEQARVKGRNVSNIQVANAVEALACLLTFKSNNGQADARLRGSTKLQNKDISSFNVMSKPSFYVSQPMRMATVQPLLALGLAETDGNSARFNAYRITALGQEILEAAFAEYRPSKNRGIDALTEWVLGGKPDNDRLKKIGNSLNPTKALPERACELLKECFMRQSDEQQARRRNAYRWMQNTTSKHSDWDSKPVEISEDHWRDMRAGAAFFRVRDAAIAVLDAVEKQINHQSKAEFSPGSEPMSDELKARLADLNELAKQYDNPEFMPLNSDAQQFCKLCLTTPQAVLIELVRLDGVVLRLSMDGTRIIPGPAFGSTPVDADDNPDESPERTATDSDLPDGISYRIHNLRLLARDFDNQLDSMLQAASGVSE